MTKIMARGTANSYPSQIKPPPGRTATKAGAEMKLMALNWVAMVEMAMAHQGRFRLPRK